MVGFLDNLLAPFRTKRVDPKETLGVSGTAAYGGFLVSAEKNPRLIGREKYKTYTDLLTNVSIVAAGARYYLNLVAKSAWKVEPSEEGGKESDDAAELIEDAMARTDTPWYRVVRRMGMFKFQGYSLAEWTARLDPDGRILLADIESRPQMTIERWDITETGEIAGVIQRAPRDQRQIYIPRSKLVYCVDDSLNDSPEGEGLLRQLAEPARQLERFQQLEGYGFESDLRGMPIAKVPFTQLNQMVKDSTISAEDREKILLPIREFLRNHIKNPQLGIAIDSAPYTDLGPNTTPSSVPQWDLSVAQNQSGAQAEVAAAIERLNREMARVIGVEHLLLGGDGKGSMALSRDKSDNFALTIDSAQVEMRQSFEKDMVEPLLVLNGIDLKYKPTLKTDSTAYRDIEQVTGALFQMAQAGAPVMPNDPAVEEVYNLLGLTKPDRIDVSTDAAGLSPIQPPKGTPVPPKPGEQVPPKPGNVPPSA